MTRKLIVNDGRTDRERLLVGRMIVGRDPACEITETDPLLSGRHAEFTSGAEVTVRDLGSRNGVLLNGEKVGQATLRPGDVVQVGRLRLTYVEESPTLATTAAPVTSTDADATIVVNPKGEQPTLVTPRAAAADPDATITAAPLTPRPATGGSAVRTAISGGADLALLAAATVATRTVAPPAAPVVAPRPDRSLLSAPITILAIGVWAATAVPFILVILGAADGFGAAGQILVLAVPLVIAVGGARLISARIARRLWDNNGQKS